ncbi:hypothetical protein [Actomonas aquatica]|uniref:PBP domain-containing protein n=1 Tax=Actomonas aquatica TaxID=2866162 RepID=A0ABZ1CDT5_9BACT|nr:hypothetical protein [Opitutus sp. WL0086]WRQ89452.1 hypothetical protein K1X11_008525 [Opitutus sp. WL0086]
MQRTLRSSLLLLLGLCTAVLSASAAPALVGNADLAGNALDADAAKAVLLGKNNKIGSARVVIIVAKNSPAQESFLKATVGMSSGQFQNHWRRLFMTGGGSAPKVVADEQAALALAASTPGAICIVDNTAAGELPVLSEI